MRFNGLQIPPGATITGASIQFTVDETRDLDPCSLSIYGEASDNATTFTNSSNNLSNRPRTNASVTWAPSSWNAVGDAGAAQQTTDIATVIQEIVDRSAYTAASSIVILIEGEGRRTAESYDGATIQAPELCVEYTLPALSARPGNPAAITTGQDNLTTGPETTIGLLSVHPNPARDWLSISFTSTLEGPVQVRARELSGKAIFNDVRMGHQGENTIRLDGLALPNGIYFLQLIMDGSAISAKFVIQK